MDVRGRFAVVVGTKALVVVDPARIAHTKIVAVEDKDRIGMLLCCLLKVDVRLLVDVVCIRFIRFEYLESYFMMLKVIARCSSHLVM